MDSNLFRTLNRDALVCVYHWMLKVMDCILGDSEGLISYDTLYSDIVSIGSNETVTCVGYDKWLCKILWHYFAHVCYRIPFQMLTSFRYA